MLPACPSDPSVALLLPALVLLGHTAALITVWHSRKLKRQGKRERERADLRETRDTLRALRDVVIFAHL